MTVEQAIVNKIDELFDPSINFIEKHRKLSPAGKFQACILTSAKVIFILDVNSGKDDFMYGDKMLRILSGLEVKLKHRFQVYAKEYASSNYNLDDLENEFLNELLKKGNELLLKYDEHFIKTSIFAGTSHIWSECERYKRGFEKFNSGQGKLLFPELMFISLYVYPFFNSTVENRQKFKMCPLIDKEVMNSNLLKINSDFMAIPADLSSYLISKMNNDTKFVNILKNDEKSNMQTQVGSNNSGCMLILSVILVMLSSLYFI